MSSSIGNGNGHSNGSVSNGQSYGNKEVTYRGDIIVNSDAFFNLCTDIHNYRGVIDSKRTGKYIDTLYFLSENGYHIIIPEMILFKAGRILASGDDINEFLGGPIDPKRHEILKPILKDASLPEGDKYKVHSNINITTDTGPDEINVFCKKIQDVSAEYTKRITQMRNSNNKPHHLDRSDIGLDEANREVMHLLEKKKEAKKKGFNYGNEAIISLIEKDYINASDKPLFILTDDEVLTERIHGIHAKFPHVNTITATSLINSIVDAGLGEKVGIPVSPPSPRPIISSKYLEKRQRQVSALFDKYKNVKVENYISPNSQFPKSLEELAAYLKQHKKEGPDLGLDKANVAKFIARQAKRVPRDPNNSGVIINR